MKRVVAVITGLAALAIVAFMYLLEGPWRPWESAQPPAQMEGEGMVSPPGFNSTASAPLTRNAPDDADDDRHDTTPNPQSFQFNSAQDQDTLSRTGAAPPSNRTGGQLDQHSASNGLSEEETMTIPGTGTDANGQAPSASITPGQIRIGSIKDLPQELRDITAKQMEDEKDLGYVPVDDMTMSFYYGGYANYLLPPQETASGFTVALADLSGTPFERLRLNGIVPDGPSPPWARATRVYTDAGGAAFFLEEWDYVASGGGALILKETINAQVGDAPAVMTIHQSPSGQSVTNLGWYSDRKSYILTVTGKWQNGAKRENLLSLARSIRESEPSSPAPAQTQAADSKKSPPLK